MAHYNDKYGTFFGRRNDEGNVNVLHVDDGAAATRLDANVHPVGSDLSARHEHAEGIVLSAGDAAMLGIEVEGLAMVNQADRDIDRQSAVSAAEQKALVIIRLANAISLDCRAIAATARTREPDFAPIFQRIHDRARRIQIETVHEEKPDAQTTAD